VFHYKQKKRGCTRKEQAPQKEIDLYSVFISSVMLFTCSKKAPSYNYHVGIRIVFSAFLSVLTPWLESDIFKQIVL